MRQMSGEKSKKDVRKKEERIGGGGIRVSVACEGMLREKRERERERGGRRRERGGFSLHFVAF